MRDFILGLKTRSDYYHNHTARHTARTLNLGTQLKHTQRVTCVVSTVKLRVAMASQRPQEIGMHRPEPH
jgi:hypothetical protein